MQCVCVCREVAIALLQQCTLTPGARYVKLFDGGGLGEQVGVHVAGVYARRDGQSAYA